MVEKNRTNKNRNKTRRGVGAIIGGVILVAILLSTVSVFFVTMLQNDRAKTGYEIQSQQDSRDKDIEEFSVIRFIEGGVLKFNVTNTGPIPIVESHWAAYCVSPSCTNKAVPVFSAASPISLTLNPGDVDIGRQVGTVTTGNNYVIQVISERGNIVSTTDCLVEGSSPNLTCSGIGDADAALEGILQGTGPLQLDLKAFGAIFPNLGTRAGIDQTGWNTRVASNYGSVTGYPGVHVPYNLNTIYTQRMRNVDTSGESLTLSRDTLVTNIDGGRNLRLPIDVVFALDSSGSMCGSPSPGNDPTGLRKTASKSFVDKLDSTVDTGAVVSWDDNVDFTYGLSNNFVTLKTQIDNVDCGGGTNLNVGLTAAIARLDANPRVEPSNEIIIFLTDGLGTYTTAANSGPAADAQSKGYKIYSINLNAPTALGPLSDMAYATSGGLYNTPSAAALQTIFDDIHKKAQVNTSIPDINYICKENIPAKTMIAYNEVTANKVIPPTAQDASPSAGWVELFFCSRSPAVAGNDYKPTNTLTSYHPLVMIARGVFNNTNEENGQTMVHQSSAVSDDDATIFNVCSRDSNVATACAAPTVADAAGTLRYSRSIGQMGTGSNIWVHVNTVTSPVTASWIYPDGTDIILSQTGGGACTGFAKDKTLNGNLNMPCAIRLPQTNSDGSPITCQAPAGTDYYTLKIIDSFDSEGRRNVYYMTFAVTGC